MKKRAETIVVAGCDPGLANLGLGAVRETGRDVAWLGSELLRTSSKMDAAERLEIIYQGVSRFLREHQPDALAIEGQFFHQQKATAFKVGQAVGVTLLAAAGAAVPVFEYGPMQVKQALVGSGRADKAQVLYMVRALLGNQTANLSHHAGDALALAITHLNARRVPAAAFQVASR